MKLNQLKPRPEIENGSRLQRAYNSFLNFFDELDKIELTDSVLIKINQEIDSINSTKEDELMKQLRASRRKILSTLEKEMKLVQDGHYRNQWMAIGMAVFGIPLGTSFGASLGNMAFLGLGLPMGMAIGIAIGTGMDKKAADEGRQLKANLNW